MATSSSAVSEYIQYLSIRDYSKETVVKYQQVLNQLQLYCITINKTVEEATTDDIRRFIIELKKRGLNEISINGYTSVLKAFFEYRGKRTETVNPARRISRQREDKVLPSNIREKDLLKLLDSIDNDPDLSLTTLAMFELLLSTGMRVSEMCKLEIKDIIEYGHEPSKKEIEEFMASQEKIKDKDDKSKPTFDWVPGIIKIRHGKGRKERLVPFSKEAETVIKKYLQFRNLQHYTSDLLFCNMSGEELNRGNVYKKIKPILDLTKSKKKGPHTLRHTYASLLINRGADISAIKDLLGHKSVATTQKYTHLDIERLKRVVQAAHPLDRIT